MITVHLAPLIIYRSSVLCRFYGIVFYYPFMSCFCFYGSWIHCVWMEQAGEGNPHSNQHISNKVLGLCVKLYLKFFQVNAPKFRFYLLTYSAVSLQTWNFLTKLSLSIQYHGPRKNLRNVVSQIRHCKIHRDLIL